MLDVIQQGVQALVVIAAPRVVCSLFNSINAIGMISRNITQRPGVHRWNFICFRSGRLACFPYCIMLPVSCLFVSRMDRILRRSIAYVPGFFIFFVFFSCGISTCCVLTSFIFPFISARSFRQIEAETNASSKVFLLCLLFLLVLIILSF